ncbi:MAG: hypothetical protein RJA49_2230 [Actinomycetota bacterium]
MNGVPPVASCLPARWLTMAPQPLAAGDHTTGLAPFVSGDGQPSTRSVVAAPDALPYGRTNTQRAPAFASGEPLKSFARVVIKAIFSELTAMSMTVHLPGSALASDAPSEAVLPPLPAPLHAPSRPAPPSRPAVMIAATE